MDWKACNEPYVRPHTLFYVDPPYWETEGYGVPFDYAEYMQMAAQLRSLRPKAIASLNDHPDIGRAFDEFHIETSDIKYAVGGGGARSRARSRDLQL